MAVRLQGSTSGYTELDAPAVAGNNNVKLPASNGAAFQIVRNGANAGELEYADKLVLETAKAWDWNSLSTNTFIDFTGIPSWVKRITVMFNGVSTSGTSGIKVQLGTASSVETSGYNGATVRTASATLSTNGLSTGFFEAPLGASTETQNGLINISLFQASSNTWACSGSFGGNSITNTTAGVKALSGVLDRLRITTVNGTDTFDAGSINIMYE